MNNVHKAKLLSITTVVILLSSAVGLVLFALKQNINLFYTPTELLNTSTAFINSSQSTNEMVRIGGYVKANDKTVRIGGYVKAKSIEFDKADGAVHFVVTDRQKEIPVIYNGLLPNLFRENQVVVVTGKLIQLKQKLFFSATQVLAKHDEKYMPRDVAHKLKDEKNI